MRENLIEEIIAVEGAADDYEGAIYANLRRQELAEMPDDEFAETVYDKLGFWPEDVNA